MSYPYCISIFQIHHMNYHGPRFTKLKYSDVFFFIIWRGQSYLDSHTLLYPVAFCDCIKNIGSLVPKYSELLTSHYGDLKFEKHLCSYASRAAVESRILSRRVICSVMMYSYILSICHTSITTLFG